VVGKGSEGNLGAFRFSGYARRVKKREKPKPKAKVAAACPVYAIEVEPFRGFSAVKAVARVKGKSVGIVEAALNDTGAFQVTYSHVESSHRRCGLGTKLYTKVAQWGCARGRNLESDEARSEYAQAFWTKQEAKKRAHCASKVPVQYRRPDLDLRPGIQNGRGGCEVYRLRCPVTDLSGRRR